MTVTYCQDNVSVLMTVQAGPAILHNQCSEEKCGQQVCIPVFSPDLLVVNDLTL